MKYQPISWSETGILSGLYLEKPALAQVYLLPRYSQTYSQPRKPLKLT